MKNGYTNMPASLTIIAECHFLKYFTLKIIKKLVFLLFVPAVVAATPSPRDTSTLGDWVPEPYAKSLCKGHYVPFVRGTCQNDNFAELPVVLSADETELTQQGQSTLRGHVTLRQGNRYLHADEVTIERSHAKMFDFLTATGDIHYFTPEFSIWGTQAKYTHEIQHFHIDDTTYHWYPRHARGFGKTIDIDENSNVHLKNASYTTCAPQQNTWELSAKEITLYPKKGRGVAKHIMLNLFEFPIFYFPYFDYPIDNKRHSGFLFPNWGSTSNSGTEITVPYYWNIAPNYDFTVAARWLSERGTEAQTKYRYLLAHSEGVFQWHFLPHDRKYSNFQEQNLYMIPGGLSPLDPRIIALEGTDNRQAFNYRHTTTWDRQWQANIIFDYVSDSNYFVDLGNDINTASTIHLPQQANLTYYGENWSHYFNVEEYQVLEPLSKPINEEIYKRQPQWVFQTYYPDEWYHLSFGLIGEAVNFAHQPDILTQQPVTTGQRLHLRPSVSWPYQESWFYITPRIQVDWLQYFLLLRDDAPPNIAKDPQRTIPLYDIDTGLFFERVFSFNDYPMVQTIEPRVYYLYVPYHAQYTYPDFDSGVIVFSYAQLFRDNRFSGRDRIGDANQVTLSLTSRFLPAKGGQEFFRISVGDILYFKDRKIALCEELGQSNNCLFFEDVTASAKRSDLVAQADVFVNPFLSGGLYWQWNTFSQTTEQASINAQYIPSAHKIINFNYYWKKHDFMQTNLATGQTGSLHQADISFLWPLALHWQALSRWHYNLQQRQTIEILGGLEYNGCCLAFQAVASRYRQAGTYFYPQAYATGYFFQVVFKGLSAIGVNNPDGKLKYKIPGYVPLVDRQKWLAQPDKNYFPPENIPLY